MIEKTDISKPSDPAQIPSGAPPTQTSSRKTAEGVTGTRDTISSDSLSSIQFPQTLTYDTSAQDPKIPPPNLDSQTEPLPSYVESAAIKQIIGNFFLKEALGLIKEEELSESEKEELYDALHSFFNSSRKGGPAGRRKEMANPKLAAIMQQIIQEASKKTQKEGRLPESWTIESSSPKDWTPKPLEPHEEYYFEAFSKALNSYAAQTSPPLNAKEIESLRLAFESGKTPSNIEIHFQAITKMAIEDVQKTFKGKVNLENWKPINLGIVTPAAVNEARAEVILNIQHYQSFLKKCSLAMNKILSHHVVR